MEYNRTKFEKLWREHEDEFWKETNKNLNNFLNYITNVNKDKNCKPNNNAPTSIKGDYDLSIHGNKIVLVDNKDGTTVEARCHPDDDFDIGVGINEAFKKMNQKREEEKKCREEEEKKIKVGDWVEITNWKLSYPIYSRFFSEHNLEDLGRNFRYGCYLNNGDKLQVAHIEGDRFVLSRKEKIGACGLQNCVYLMDIHSLKKVAKPNA